MKSIKQQICDNIRARGYYDGWTDEQIAARQICKMGEELSELACTVKGDYHIWVPLWVSSLDEAGRWCGGAFDDPHGWKYAHIEDIENAKSELADVLVTLRNLEAALDRLSGPYDADEAALAKSEADIERGVR